MIGAMPLFQPGVPFDSGGNTGAGKAAAEGVRADAARGFESMLTQVERGIPQRPPLDAGGGQPSPRPPGPPSAAALPRGAASFMAQAGAGLATHFPPDPAAAAPSGPALGANTQIIPARGVPAVPAPAAKDVAAPERGTDGVPPAEAGLDGGAAMARMDPPGSLRQVPARAEWGVSPRHAAMPASSRPLSMPPSSEVAKPARNIAHRLEGDAPPPPDRDGRESVAAAPDPAPPAPEAPAAHARAILPVPVALPQPATPPADLTRDQRAARGGPQSTAAASGRLARSPDAPDAAPPPAPIWPDDAAMPTDFDAPVGSRPVRQPAAPATPPAHAEGMHQAAAATLATLAVQSRETHLPPVQPWVPQTPRRDAIASPAAPPPEEALALAPDALPDVPPDIPAGTPATPASPARQIADAVATAMPAATTRLDAPAAMEDGKGPLKVLEIQLQPHDLGVVHVKLSLSAGRLVMRVEAAEAETTRLIGQERERLAQSLRAAGYAVDAVSVETGRMPAPPPGSEPRPSADTAAGRNDAPGGNNAGQAGSQGGESARQRGRPPAPTEFSVRDVPSDGVENSGGRRARGGLYV